MRDVFARRALQAVEVVREQVARSAGRRISRASIARRAGVNDSTITRGLGDVAARPSTVARYAGGLLSAVSDLHDREPRSLTTKPFDRAVELAAQALAFAVGELADAKAAEVKRAKRLRNAIGDLEGELYSTIVDAYRLERSLLALTTEWLEAPADSALRLACIGAATAVVCRMPLQKPEVAHA